MASPIFILLTITLNRLSLKVPTYMRSYWSNNAVITVLLNYNFTFTRVSTRGATCGLRGKCQKLPWKASFPRDGPWLFHAKTCGISRHVAFPQDELWNFHETSSHGISTRPVIVEFPRGQSPLHLAWNFHETSSHGA